MFHEAVHEPGKARGLVNRPGHAIFLMCCAGLCFGLSSVILKACCATIQPFECAFFRTGVGFFILLIMTALGLRERTIGHRVGLLFVRGFFGGMAALAYIWSISKLELGLANGLNQTSPIFVCIFAALFLRERFAWWIYAVVGVAFCGMALIVHPDMSGVNSAALIALGSGIVSAIAYTCVRVLQKTESSETIVMWLLGTSTIAAALSAFFIPWTMPDGLTWIGLIGAGLTAFFAQLLMTGAYRFAPATIVAPFIYLSTFSSLIIAFFVWNELPGITSLIGCGIVVVCAILIGILPRRRKAPESKEDRAAKV